MNSTLGFHLLVMFGSLHLQEINVWQTSQGFTDYEGDGSFFLLPYGFI